VQAQKVDLGTWATVLAVSGAAARPQHREALHFAGTTKKLFAPLEGTVEVPAKEGFARPPLVEAYSALLVWAWM
jgi:hypothetical protein